MFNIGCVLYKKGPAPGTLVAEWSHSDFGNGTGLATEGPAEGWVGIYRVVYSDEQGKELSSHTLKIEKDGKYYTLLWINDDVVRFRGRGMEVKEGLAAGWRSTKHG
jgi:hypothetical protein